MVGCHYWCARLTGKCRTGRQQWMGLEACKLSEELWTRLMQESYQMIQCFRQLQAQQLVPPPPQPALHPAVQQHQQSAFVCPSSAPPVVTPPTFHQQISQPQPWQPITDLQLPQNWPPFSGNISVLNTSGLSSFLDHAVGQPGGQPAPGTSSQMHTPEGRPDSRTSSTSDILSHVSQAMDQDL